MFEIVQSELNMKPHSIVAIETKRPSRIPSLILLSKLIFYSLLIMPNAARAQWPDHVIRLIVPYGVGSNMDTVARLIAAKLGEQLRQSVIVENRVGGTTIIGTNAIAK
jgi:tripartite-type tricarboxylate transporter receptor subunit TctC